MASWDHEDLKNPQYKKDYITGKYPDEEEVKGENIYNVFMEESNWKSDELRKGSPDSYEPNITFTPTTPYVSSWTLPESSVSTFRLTNSGSELVDWKINTGTPPTKFKFNENVYIRELDLYIQDTYKQHYGGGQYQATDMIIDTGHGESFCIGNIMKYAMRYGKKDGYNRKDLLKIIHYAVIALHCLDEKEKEKANGGSNF